MGEAAGRRRLVLLVATDPRQCPEPGSLAVLKAGCSMTFLIASVLLVGVVLGLAASALPRLAGHRVRVELGSPLPLVVPAPVGPSRSRRRRSGWLLPRA